MSGPIISVSEIEMQLIRQVENLEEKMAEVESET